MYKIKLKQSINYKISICRISIFYNYDNTSTIRKFLKKKIPYYTMYNASIISRKIKVRLFYITR